MGSFHIGRESDLNEDRVISKETCDALMIQKLNNNKMKENEIYVPSENTTHSNNNSLLVSLQ